jgi:hypothetical protein
MPLVLQTCHQCQQPFEVTVEDLAFYDKISPVFAGKKEAIPPPTFCPQCRLQRRLAFRNMIYVYSAPSANSGRPIFSRFPPTSPFPILENAAWFGGTWDALEHGRNVDLGQPFLPQLRSLRDRVPHRALSLTQAENSEYCNNNSSIKNCYFVFGNSFSEDCLYCEFSQYQKDCIDCSFSPSCELCYGCTACDGCYGLHDSQCCQNCNDSVFLAFCRSCRNCFGCVNLRHKQYCVFNEQKTKAEYEAFLREFRGSSWEERRRYAARFERLLRSQPRPHAILRNAEASTGNFLSSTRGIHDSHFVSDAEDVRHGFSLYGGTRDAYDYSYFGLRTELMYECVQCGIDDQRVLFSFDAWDGNNTLLYCWMCHGCSDCFGCVGLRKKSHCILNVQYSKEEYEALVPRIIAPLREAGEWGEFFPTNFCPVPYNHSVAQRYFPLTRPQALTWGYGWYEREKDEGVAAIDAATLPDGLPPTDNAIIVRSALSGRPFKITPQEIRRYRQFGVPLPRLTYDERMEERARTLGGVRLYERACAKTGKPIRTIYSSDSPYVIWDREE